MWIPPHTTTPPLSTARSAAGNQQLLAQGIAQRWGEPTPHPQQGALF
jgi:hypothetical protein